MREYLAWRAFFMIFLLAIVSVFSFIIIQLPPGDYLTIYIGRLEQEMGTAMDPAAIEALKVQHGLNRPMHEQYFRWVFNMFKGDFGRSLEWNQPVSKILSERLGLTVLLSLLTLIFTYAVAIPIGIYTARNQYSPLDYLFSGIGFIGLATPSFFLALILMFLLNQFLGVSAGGVQSVKFIDAPASLPKFIDFCLHLPLPIIVIGLAGTASVIRIMRAALLDEIKRPYVTAARARGLEEKTLLYRYPVRLALNPIISTIGSVLPGIISGATVTAIVLDIPTIGAVLYSALLSQDMFLAGSSIMILSFMTILGTFISDVILVLVDPRIRLAK